MPIRDLLLAVLLVFNAYFAYAIYGLNTENQAVLIPKTLDSQVEENNGINYTDYATLYMFKEILPADIFDKELLPQIETALKDANISKDEWRTIQLQVQKLEADKTINFSELYLEKLKQKGLGNTLDQMFGDFGDEASSLGNILKQDFKDFIDKQKENFQKEESNPKGQNNQDEGEISL